ncbi:unnamed protein product [Gongylonema pulchrum]|uniref:Uncharacterized protein n=1 Tax=Gongylonema pulchrum TaxID=637853 RepID=A0A183EPW8_9BILA|nr:unnamed protein product [Gongylonema pulchrum]
MTATLCKNVTVSGSTTITNSSTTVSSGNNNGAATGTNLAAPSVAMKAPPSSSEQQAPSLNACKWTTIVIPAGATTATTLPRPKRDFRFQVPHTSPFYERADLLFGILFSFVTFL